MAMISDIDSTYMTAYNLRLFKIFDDKAEMIFRNVTLKSGGICDDVEFTSVRSQLDTNTEGAAAAVSNTISVLTTAGSTTGGVDAASIAGEFCPLRKATSDRDVSGAGRRNGGAIYFSGKSLEITDSDFIDNHVTGNGGAIYVEPAQPGRAIMDPDGHSSRRWYPYASPTKTFLPPPQDSYAKCSFTGNNAMSTDRGT